MPWKNTAASRRASDQTYDSRWRRKRNAYLEQHPNCEIRLDGCTVKATQVDHTIGAKNDPDHQHLRSGCGHCHRKITAQQGGGYRTPKTTDPEPRPSTAW